MHFYRFVCWEQTNPTHMPSVIGRCALTSRLAYFDTVCDLSLDITSFAISPYRDTLDSHPLIAVHLSGHRTTYYALLSDLAESIASAQEDDLWEMLLKLTSHLPPEHRLA
jgi:hypothetical protein